VLSATLVLVTATAACRDDAPTAPSAPPAAPATSVRHAGHAMHAVPGADTTFGATVVRTVRGVQDAVAAFVGRFLDTPLGTQPIITPSLRIERPTGEGRVRRDQPVTIRVRYADFDMRPELRTPNAGATLGSEPQVVTDGYVQGHVHGYLQALDRRGRALPDVNATSFCVLERVVVRRGYHGVVEGECPGVPAGEYRLSVEFQTNSHTAILKDGPRAVPTSDVLTIRVR
jgi:hypothetical protein